MRDYYRRASELHGVFRSVTAAPARGGSPPPLRGLTKRRPAQRLRRCATVGSTPSPRRCARAARPALRLRHRPVRGGAALRRAHARDPRAPLASSTARCRGSREAAASSSTPARRGRVGLALRAMHETGFLGRFLPECGRVTLPRPARLLPPLHGGRAHPAGDRGARRGRRGNDTAVARLRPGPRRGPGRRPALPRDAAARHRQGPRGRPRPSGARASAPRACERLRARPSRPPRTSSSSWAPTSRCPRSRSSATSREPALIGVLRRAGGEPRPAEPALPC